MRGSDKDKANEVLGSSGYGHNNFYLEYETRDMSKESWFIASWVMSENDKNRVQRILQDANITPTYLLFENDRETKAKELTAIADRNLQRKEKEEEK